MIASACAICATRRLCSWMFSGYVLCMSPQRRMNFIRDRYAKKWLVMPRGQTLSFGSSVSRSQSPSRLTLSAVRASAAPGNAASHHATYRKSRLSDSMLPQAGVGGCTPNPRKLIAASATMKDENWRLATTMMEGTTFGRTRRNRGRGRGGGGGRGGRGAGGPGRGGWVRGGGRGGPGGGGLGAKWAAGGWGGASGGAAPAATTTATVRPMPSHALSWQRLSAALTGAAPADRATRRGGRPRG